MPIKSIVSVILPVYNSEKYLDDAIKSILNQTFKEFEFIILLDGCTDKSVEIAKSYKDSRIQLIIDKKNKGFVFRLNEGLNLAKGQYISIMNSDDIAVEDKLKKQITLLKSNKNIGICGTWIERFGKYNDIVKHSSDYHNILVDLLYGNPFSHPSVVFDKKYLKKLSPWYDENFATAEDYDLFQRMMLLTEGVNITEVLLKYRTHESQMSETQQEIQRKNSISIRKRFFETIFFKLNAEDLFCWNKLINVDFFEFSETIRLFNFITKVKNTPQVILPAASMKEFTYRLEKIIYDKYYLFEKDQRVIYHENFALKDKLSNSNEEILQLNEKIGQFSIENKTLIHENQLLSLEVLPKVDGLKEHITSNLFSQKDFIENVVRDNSIAIREKIQQNKEEQEKGQKSILENIIKNYSSDIKERIQKEREEQEKAQKNILENIIKNYSSDIKEKIQQNGTEQGKARKDYIENALKNYSLSIKERIQQNIEKQEIELEKKLTTLFKELNNVKLETEKMNDSNHNLKSENTSLIMETILGYRKQIENIQNQFKLLSDKQAESNDPVSVSKVIELNNKILDVYKQYTEAQKESVRLLEIIKDNESLLNLRAKEISDGNSKIELLNARLFEKETEKTYLISEINNLKEKLETKLREFINVKLSEENFKLENTRLYELIETQQAEFIKLQVGLTDNSNGKMQNNNNEGMSNANEEKLNELMKIINEKDELLERVNVKNRIYQNYQENFITQKNNLEQRIKLLEDLIQHMRIKERLKRFFRLKGI